MADLLEGLACVSADAGSIRATQPDQVGESAGFDELVPCLRGRVDGVSGSGRGGRSREKR